MKQPKRMRTRDLHQRRAYAARRASLAVDRLIIAQSLDEKIMASKWAKAWMRFAHNRKMDES